MEVISFTTQLTEKDYKRAFWEMLFQRKKYWISMIWWILVLSILLRIFLNDTYSILFAVLVVFVWIILFNGYHFISYRKVVSKRNRVLDKVEWVAYAGALRGKRGDYEFEISLADLSDVEETRHYYIARIKREWYMLLPKREVPVSVQKDLHGERSWKGRR